MTLIAILAIALVIGGVLVIVRGSLLIGVLMIVVGLVIGPGGIVLTR